MTKLELLLVGPTGNTHVASSLMRAAIDLGISADLIDTAPAHAGPPILRKIAWHLRGRRPLRLEAFSNHVLKRAMEGVPATLISIGQVPVRGDVLRRLRAEGTRCINFSTDDPFNPAVRAPWHLEDLVAYDVVYTPRRANIDDLRQHGCKDVRYLPFAFDDYVLSLQAHSTSAEAPLIQDCVLFVGGADKDRINFLAEFAEHGPPVTLVGGYWDREEIRNAHSVGLRSVTDVARMTAAAGVNLCLVRRANRDGHVMRSFEIAAVGGFMLAEDTADHRELFGPEGRCVLYFKTAREAAEKSLWALEHAEERRKMAASLRNLIRGGRHTYHDRLATMLEISTRHTMHSTERDRFAFG